MFSFEFSNLLLNHLKFLIFKSSLNLQLKLENMMKNSSLNIVIFALFYFKFIIVSKMKYITH